MHSEQCTVQSKNKAQNVLNWTRQIVVGVQRGEKPLVRNACHSKTGGSHVITIHLHVCNSILSRSDFSAETKQTDSNTYRNMKRKVKISSITGVGISDDGIT